MPTIEVMVRNCGLRQRVLSSNLTVFKYTYERAKKAAMVQAERRSTLESCVVVRS